MNNEKTPDGYIQEQAYEKYTNEDHETWSVLYNRQIKTIQDVASKRFLNGAYLLGFTANAIPDYTKVNAHLKPLTGWTIYAVPGLIPNDLFFHRMADKEFAATCWIRKRAQLDYLEEPDIFHDVFGHVPLLADNYITDFLKELARIAVAHLDNEIVIEYIARLYWYTIEFGLVKEDKQLKIYGAGILSSIGETQYCLSKDATLVPFDTGHILNTPYIKDRFQTQYFVLDSMEQLRESIGELENVVLNLL